MRKKRSIIWKIEKHIIESVVAKSTSFSDVLKELNISNVGGNIATLKKRLKEEKICFDHIPEGRNSNGVRKRGGGIAPPLCEVMTVNSKYSRSSLKKRLLDEGLLKDVCYECGQPSVWNEKRLVLVLDHINGARNDNRIENLRMLCPNCNSQTDTFAGKRKQYIAE